MKIAPVTRQIAPPEIISEYQDNVDLLDRFGKESNGG
jgi:hypothetical protein